MPVVVLADGRWWPALALAASSFGLHVRIANALRCGAVVSVLIGPDPQKTVHARVSWCRAAGGVFEAELDAAPDAAVMDRVAEATEVA